MRVLPFLCILLIGQACTPKNDTINSQPAGSQTDSVLLDEVQKASMNYMWQGADPTTGMAYERIHMDNNYGYNDPTVITTGGSGFGIAGLIAAMDRGFISRTEGVERLHKIVTFLNKADRFHGIWPHWLHADGKVVPFGTKDNGGDLVESSFLMQGLLCARQYMDATVPREKALIDSINVLWQGMEFDWYRRGGQNVLYWHWSPNYGWDMNLPIQGYNEALIVYILAASSPTHGIPKDCYTQGWARNGAIKSTAAPYGYALELNHNGASATGGPLFWAHYSYIGLCPKNLSDSYANYWNVVRNHALSNCAYCSANPKNYKNYSSACWGLTAGYSPNGYAAHAPNNDLGVITPTAALSSMPYTPNESLMFLRYLNARKDLLWGKYGYYDGFSDSKNWYCTWYLAIDQLTIAPMIENYRSGLLWRLFMSCPEIQSGLTQLGFTSHL